MSTNCCDPSILISAHGQPILYPQETVFDRISLCDPAIFPADTLSLGDLGDFQDDDFRLSFSAGSVFAVGLVLVLGFFTRSFAAIGFVVLSLSFLFFREEVAGHLTFFDG